MMGCHAEGGGKKSPGREKSRKEIQFYRHNFYCVFVKTTTRADWALDSAENCKTFFRTTTTTSHSSLHPLFSHLVFPIEFFARHQHTKNGLSLSLTLSIYCDISDFHSRYQTWKTIFRFSVIISTHTSSSRPLGVLCRRNKNFELSINFHFASRFETIKFVEWKNCFLAVLRTKQSFVCSKGGK